MARVWKIAVSLLLAFWIGGLTFYSVVVVPAGTELWGATDQGLLTRHVTAHLNLIGSAVLAVLLVDTVIARCRWLATCWSLMLLAQVGLFVLHAMLVPFVDSDGRLAAEYSAFYALHRTYLLVTAVQWLAGIGYFVRLVAR